MKEFIIDKLIFLVGMPGSGKTTLGKRLSKAMQLPFLDLDAAIEQKEQMPITEIFTANGEAYFRRVETEALKNIQLRKGIVATGGGAPCFHSNMEYINQKGISVWLLVSPKTLAERVLRKQGSRPLLKDMEGETLIKELTEKLNHRKTFYEQAHIHFNQSEQPFTELEKNIKSYLQQDF